MNEIENMNMVSLFEAVTLAVIQGVTEWLPVSSSGHLVLAQTFFGLKEAVAYDTLLHVATLLVILAYFKSDLLAILSDALKEAKHILGGKKLRKTKNIQMLYYITLASLPTALIGILFKDVLENLYSDLLAAGLGFIVTGIFLLASNMREGKTKITTPTALIIGLSQGLSIIPSVSRSGATIATALFFGVTKEEAARFSFLIAVPAIVGAMLLESPALYKDLATSWMQYSVGFVTALAVGYITLGHLMKIVKEGGLHYFAYYVIPLGIISVIASSL